MQKIIVIVDINILYYIQLFVVPICCVHRVYSFKAIFPFCSTQLCTYIFIVINASNRFNAKYVKVFKFMIYYLIKQKKEDEFALSYFNMLHRCSHRS